MNCQELLALWSCRVGTFARYPFSHLKAPPVFHAISTQSPYLCVIIRIGRKEARRAELAGKVSPELAENVHPAHLKKVGVFLPVLWAGGSLPRVGILEESYG